MKLWILLPLSPLVLKNIDNPWKPWYDKSFGFVVRAETEEQARQLAAELCGNERKEAWISTIYSSCDELTNDGPAEIIMKDYALA